MEIWKERSMSPYRGSIQRIFVARILKTLWRIHVDTCVEMVWKTHWMEGLWGLIEGPYRETYGEVLEGSMDGPYTGMYGEVLLCPMDCSYERNICTVYGKAYGGCLFRTYLVRFYVALWRVHIGTCWEGPGIIMEVPYIWRDQALSGPRKCHRQRCI